MHTFNNEKSVRTSFLSFVLICIENANFLCYNYYVFLRIKLQGEITVKKIARIVSLIITVLMVLQSVAVFTVSADGASQQGATGNYFNMSVDNAGWDIYNPESITAGMGYRYGASMIKNDDGSIDAWFACKGDGQGKTTGILDFISYKHSPDGGHTWGDEKIVLAPTALSADCKSCCDPGVIHFGGYYYIGYTGTLDYAGYANNIFVARYILGSLTVE